MFGIVGSNYEESFHFVECFHVWNQLMWIDSEQFCNDTCDDSFILLSCISKFSLLKLCQEKCCSFFTNCGIVNIFHGFHCTLSYIAMLCIKTKYVIKHLVIALICSINYIHMQFVLCINIPGSIAIAHWTKNSTNTAFTGDV